MWLESTPYKMMLPSQHAAQRDAASHSLYSQENVQTPMEMQYIRQELSLYNSNKLESKYLTTFILQHSLYPLRQGFFSLL